MKLRRNNWPSTQSGIFGFGFNADASCVSISCMDGFRIYNLDPFKERLRLSSTDGSLGITEMLDRTNYMALVGSGNRPRFPTNKVLIWNAAKRETSIELEFKSEVLAVKLQRHRIVVVLYDRVFVYTFESNPRQLACYETGENENGLVVLSEEGLLGFPSKKDGYIQFMDVSWIDSDAQSNTNSAIIPAHSSKLACLALSQDGALVASASIKGTLIRVFECSTGKLVHELRRGADRADIWTMAFSQDSKRLCVGSDKGTVHIFNLTESFNGPLEDDVSEVSLAKSSVQSSMSFLKDLLPKYFSSVWSNVICRVPPELPFTAAFTDEGRQLAVVSADGFIYLFSVDSPDAGGECARTGVYRLLK